MRKNVWIWNHYATNMYKNQGGRHYWFSENLINKGYNSTIFCASTFHGSNKNLNIDRKYTSNIINDIPFVFVKTPSYSTNGFDRIKNMLAFYKNLFPVSKEYAKLYGKPDVILASSVHPLTLIAGIKIAKEFGIPCICEVRDLWPESIVAYGSLKKSSLITKLLYQGEKWIYKKADSIIMTWEGGVDYLKEQGWDKTIDLSKVKHISNGVVLDSYDENSKKYKVNDPDLVNKEFKKITYTGSIRKVNNLGVLLDTAKIIQDKGLKNLRFLIYGSGDECEMLKKRCEDENIKNVIFKGRVEKKYVPAILKSSDLNILHNTSTTLDKYGQSQNKLFEYLAAGRCILQTYTTGYSILERYECGISVNNQSAEEIASAIIRLNSSQKNLNSMGVHARNAAYDFDFGILTDKLIDVIEDL